MRRSSTLQKVDSEGYVQNEIEYWKWKAEILLKEQVTWVQQRNDAWLENSKLQQRLDELQLEVRQLKEALDQKEQDKALVRKIDKLELQYSINGVMLSFKDMIREDDNESGGADPKDDPFSHASLIAQATAKRW